MPGCVGAQWVGHVWQSLLRAGALSGRSDSGLKGGVEHGRAITWLAGGGNVAAHGSRDVSCNGEAQSHPSLAFLVEPDSVC